MLVKYLSLVCQRRHHELFYSDLRRWQTNWTENLVEIWRKIRSYNLAYISAWADVRRRRKFRIFGFLAENFAQNPFVSLAKLVF